MIPWRKLGVMVAVACVIAATAPPASAGPPQPSTYLALGDSVAAGDGADPPAENGYVSVLHDTLVGARHCGKGQALGCRLDLENLAVPGATTTSLVSNQLPAAVALLQRRNSDSTPVNDVALITIDIGGNDLFGPVTNACSEPGPECLATIQQQLHLVTVNYESMLSALRAAAGPGTVIAVMTYYNPLGACHLFEMEALADFVLEGDVLIPAGLNDIIREAAARHDAVVVETAPLIDPDDLVGGQDCLHPDDSGHADIAAAFAAAIADVVVGPPGARRWNRPGHARPPELSSARFQPLGS